MKQTKSRWLDIVGSGGAIMTTLVAMIYFGWGASLVARVFLYLLGTIIVLLAGALLVPWHRFRQPTRHTSVRPVEPDRLVEFWRTKPVESRVRDELQRAAA